MTAWRGPAWTVVTVAVAVLAFQAGVESYDREHCGPDAIDCDLGFLRGAPWAALAVLATASVLVVVEVALARRRRVRR